MPAPGPRALLAVERGRWSNPRETQTRRGLREERKGGRLTGAIEAGCYGIQEGVLGSQEAPHHRHFRTCSGTSPWSSGGKREFQKSWRRRRAGRGRARERAREQESARPQSRQVRGARGPPFACPGAEGGPGGHHLRAAGPRTAGWRRAADAGRPRRASEIRRRAGAGDWRVGTRPSGARSDVSGSALAAAGRQRQEASPRRGRRVPARQPPADRRLFLSAALHRPRRGRSGPAPCPPPPRRTAGTPTPPARPRSHRGRQRPRTPAAVALATKPGTPGASSLRRARPHFPVAARLPALRVQRKVPGLCAAGSGRHSPSAARRLTSSRPEGGSAALAPTWKLP